MSIKKKLENLPKIPLRKLLKLKFEDNKKK